MNDKEIDLILKKTIVKRFQKDEILLWQGQIPTECYMVIEGCVREDLIKDSFEKSTAFLLKEIHLHLLLVMERACLPNITGNV